MKSRFGVHIDPPLAAIPAMLEARGLSHFQTTLRDPMRLANLGVPDELDQHAYFTGAAACGGLWGIAHASLHQKNYMIALHILHSFFTQPEPIYSTYKP